MDTELGGGRYRVDSVLGEGGMGCVYLARDAELDRPVAIKVLDERYARDPEFYERFLREARLAARLSHPNVVRVYDTSPEGERPFIVMEYVDGWTLAEELRRQDRLAPAEAVGVVRQVCAGLQHAHEEGLVHRDVKPANLLLRRDGVVKIVDFGIARAAEATRLTEIGTILGTAAYLAPEQAAGQEVTAAADVYSVGVVLYELLTGRTPYAATSLPALVAAQQAGEVEPARALAPAVSPELEAVVLACLARDPAARPESAAELSVLLDGTPRRVRALWGRRQRRQRRLVAAGAVLLAALGIGLGLGLASGEGSKGKPVRVEPVPRGATPAQDARNLAQWLRRYSR
jgi:serine/threonine-protein kinase